jgi:hypothetical protein
MDRRKFIAAAGGVAVIASASQAARMGVLLVRAEPGGTDGDRPGARTAALFRPKRACGRVPRSGYKFCRGYDSNYKASRGSCRPTDCDRPIRTRAFARHL